MHPPIPLQLVAGDTWSFTFRDLGRFPDCTAANGWALTLSFRGPDKLDLTATTDANGVFTVITTATETQPGSGVFTQASNLAPGQYGWVAKVSKAGEVHSVASGSVEVKVDVAQLNAGADTRSWVKQTLDSIRANLQGRASRAEQSYQVNGRSLQLMSPKELMELEETFSTRYAAEVRAQRGGQVIESVRAGFGHRHPHDIDGWWPR